MKKLLLCLTVIFTINAASAQTWCPPGAKWHFKRGWPYSVSGVDGVMELTYTGNATMLGVPCNKLDAVFTGVDMLNGTGTNVATQGFNTYYTHLTNGVLYILNGNRFDTIVDFNAGPGDKWLRPGFDSGAVCNSRRPYTVIDTGRVLLNGFNLKKVTASYSAYYSMGQSTTTFVVQQTFVERILFYNWASYNLFPIDCEVNDLIAETPMTQFRCYEDSGFPLYNLSNYGCSSLTGLNGIKGNNFHLAVYPNPNHGSFLVELEQPADIKIFNLLGELVYTNYFEETGRLAIAPGQLAPGTYLLKAITADGTGHVKFIRQ